jgi:hypothetical protein
MKFPIAQHETRLASGLEKTYQEREEIRRRRELLAAHSAEFEFLRNQIVEVKRLRKEALDVERMTDSRWAGPLPEPVDLGK